MNTIVKLDDEASVEIKVVDEKVFFSVKIRGEYGKIYLSTLELTDAQVKKLEGELYNARLSLGYVEG